MANDVDKPNQLLETLLFYLRHRYLSATECLLLIYLHGIADRTGFGCVTPESLSIQLGRSRQRCRGYLKRLERHGLLHATQGRSLHDAGFQLEMAVADAGNGEHRLGHQNAPNISDASR